MRSFSVIVGVLLTALGVSSNIFASEQFDFSRSSWSAFNTTHEGKKYCVLGTKPIRSSQGFNASKVVILYTPQIQSVTVVNEEQSFRADRGHLVGRHESYRMTFHDKGGLLWSGAGGDRFDQIALESPTMKIVAGKVWVAFRNTGFRNAFEKAANYCGVTYSLPLP